MVGPPPEIDEWIKIAGVVGGGLIAGTVALSGILRAYWDYRIQYREAEALKVDTTRALPTGPLQDLVSVQGVMDGLADIATAIREASTAETEREQDRLVRAVEALAAANRDHASERRR